jgi:hypothetical protein
MHYSHPQGPREINNSRGDYEKGQSTKYTNNHDLNKYLRHQTSRSSHPILSDTSVVSPSSGI